MSEDKKKPAKVFVGKISSKKRKTYLRMLKSIIGATICIIVALIVLQFLGVDVTSMLTGVGIASIIIGFALQDALKDIIRGIEIVTNSYFEIGDIIKFGDTTGEVLTVGLRTTRVRDSSSANIVSVANRNLEKVEVVSEYVYLQVPLPYEIKPEAAEKVMLAITKNILNIKNVTTAEYQGLTQIAETALIYQISITCSEPMNRGAVRRAALGVVTQTLAEHKLRLPYPRVDVRGKIA